MTRLDPKQSAQEWYSIDEVFKWLNQKASRLDEETSARRVPTDVYSVDFAEWFTNEIRLAMAKGIQRANDAHDSGQ